MVKMVTFCCGFPQLKNLMPKLNRIRSKALVIWPEAAPPTSRTGSRASPPGPGPSFCSRTVCGCPRAFALVVPSAGHVPTLPASSLFPSQPKSYLLRETFPILDHTQRVYLKGRPITPSPCIPCHCPHGSPSSELIAFVHLTCRQPAPAPARHASTPGLAPRGPRPGLSCSLLCP